MKILSMFFTVVILLFFASCTKEAILEPQTESTNQENLLPFPTAANTGSTSNTGATERSTSLQIEVSRVSVETSTGELTVYLAAGYNLSGVTLESTQHLSFADVSGNVSVLTFTVNYALGSNGALNVVFAIGGNNLTGLEMREMQEIIIEEDLAI